MVIRADNMRWVFGALLVAGVLLAACDGSRGASPAGSDDEMAGGEGDGNSQGAPSMVTDLEVPEVEAAGMDDRKPALLLKVDREEIRLSREPLVGRWREGFVRRIAEKQAETGWWQGLVAADELRDELAEAGVSLEPGPSERLVAMEAGRVDRSQRRGGAVGRQIVPVLDGLDEANAEVRQLDEVLGLERERRVAIAVEADVPVATVLQILYTAGQAGFIDFELWAQGESGERGAVRYSAPTLGGHRPPDESPRKLETCVRPTVAVGAEGIVVYLGANSQPESAPSKGPPAPVAEPVGVHRADSRPSWDGKALVDSSGACPTVGTEGTAEMERLRARLDGIEFAPLCRRGSLTVADPSIGYGRFLDVLAGLEAHDHLEVTIAVLGSNDAGSVSDCESTTDGRLAGDWSYDELQLLYDRDRENFRRLVRHLQQDGPWDAEKRRELERELADWPDRLKAVPAGGDLPDAPDLSCEVVEAVSGRCIDGPTPGPESRALENYMADDPEGIGTQSTDDAFGGKPDK